MQHATWQLNATPSVISQFQEMLTSLTFHSDSDFTSVSVSVSDSDSTALAWADQSGMNWNIMPWALTDQLL